MKKELTCIICPIGCTVSAEIIDGRVASISGNACPRGKRYTEEEMTTPKRTLTTTVKTSSGKLVSCKTDRPIPKEKLLLAMEIVNSVRIDLPISIGDVIIEDVFGARLVATENKS